MDINELIGWYFDNCKAPTSFNKQSAASPRLSQEVWDTLLLTAIQSFSHGLEQSIDIEDRRIANKLHRQAVNKVGDQAFRTIAYLMTILAADRAINE